MQSTQLGAHAALHQLVYNVRFATRKSCVVSLGTCTALYHQRTFNLRYATQKCHIAWLWTYAISYARAFDSTKKCYIGLEVTLQTIRLAADGPWRYTLNSYGVASVCTLNLRFARKHRSQMNTAWNAMLGTGSNNRRKAVVYGGACPQEFTGELGVMRKADRYTSMRITQSGRSAGVRAK